MAAFLLVTEPVAMELVFSLVEALPNHVTVQIVSSLRSFPLFLSIFSLWHLFFLFTYLSGTFLRSSSLIIIHEIEKISQD